jgi:hypothetical protein
MARVPKYVVEVRCTTCHTYLPKTSRPYILGTPSHSNRYHTTYGDIVFSYRMPDFSFFLLRKGLPSEPESFWINAPQ